MYTMIIVNHEDIISSPKSILINKSPTLTVSMDEKNSTEEETAFVGVQQNTTITMTMDDIEINKQQPIGTGASAIVYSGIYLPLNKRVAVKVIDLDFIGRDRIDALRRETAVMALCKHPNVLQVLGTFIHGTKLYIITPFISLGSCLDIMKLKYPDGLDEVYVATILKQVLEGLVYMHKNGHIHRDIKAGNLLMDDHGTVLISDFGVSGSLLEKGKKDYRTTFVGTPCWMAPEVISQENGYDSKADIWSFGITAIELFTGHAPNSNLPPMKVLIATLMNDPPTLDTKTTLNKFSLAFKEMVDSCLNKIGVNRPSAEKLLKHPFFKQAKKPEWLVKNWVSTNLPSIDSRPPKKIMAQHNLKPSTTSIHEEEEWNFNKNHNSSKRHISFGNVVVRKPPIYQKGIKHHASSESWSYSPVSNKLNILADTNSSTVQLPSVPFSSSPIRKGRALSDDFTNDSLRRRQQAGILFPTFLPYDGNHHHKKTPSVTFSEESRICEQLNGKLIYRPISQNDPIQNKKFNGRVNIQRSPSPPYQSVPLSRNNSNKSMSPPSSKGSYILAGEEPIKIGRFELSHNYNDSISSSKQQSITEALSSNSTTHSNNSSLSSSYSYLTRNIRHFSIETQLHELVKQNELQKQALLSLVSSLEPRMINSTSLKAQQEMIASMELQLQACQRETLLLQRENVIMRRQIDELKNSSKKIV
ncbi:kinase-like domain-containing protein [Cokeromyces recurvatus]|uniref:kinase-like domain-containing protein n=1 Tax=Cokeromyces recurvatus TaxID=90255 RepID=UPI00221E7A47|nr:kinase-like domain-containing protein [Cokeromyces recurvatus]KAI7898151.1 kinase-like domain-containing protein [Cokeromyces recurvatus]